MVIYVINFHFRDQELGNSVKFTVKFSEEILVGDFLDLSQLPTLFNLERLVLFSLSFLSFVRQVVFNF